MRPVPTILEVDSSRLEEVLGRVEQALAEDDAALIRELIEAYRHLTELVGDKDTSIRRLRELLFGASTEKTAAVVGTPSPTPASPEDGTPPGTPPDHATDTTDPGPTDAAAPRSAASPEPPPPPPGHGRLGADAYGGAEQVPVAHATLQAGDACPSCGKGTVYDKTPGVLVRITGQPPLRARVYQLQKLRCHLCGRVFTATAPQEAGPTKYDAAAGSLIGLLKYGSGLPFNRLAGLQGLLAIPLPASTQWDVVQATATQLTPAFEELTRQAAQGDVVHNDDTTIKILELMAKGSRDGGKAEAGDEADREDTGATDKRTGLFTSGVVALRDGYRVALFFSGRRHAGENLAEVLKHRAAELPPPIQMCDALSRNLPGELQTILAHCLAHARRNFVEVHDRFPQECRHLLETLAVVYRNDALGRERQLSPAARLRFHQEQSQPVMDELHAWLSRQLDDRLVEPNSALGGAIRYMLRHWEKLTLFLRQAGAPLDNNICERALKKAILHRKNALFYKTQNGALVGDLFMSLIYSCQLNEVNPFDYLTQLQRHAEAVAAQPEQWLPWNYRASLSQARSTPTS